MLLAELGVSADKSRAKGVSHISKTEVMLECGEAAQHQHATIINLDLSKLNDIVLACVWWENKAVTESSQVYKNLSWINTGFITHAAKIK